MKFARILAIAAVALAIAGCETDRYDHRPPPGAGSLIVDNYTASALEVFIDGVPVERVRAWRDRAYDLAPGVHRLALRDGYRFFGGDVDILQDRRTIAEVYEDADGWTYRVILQWD